MNVSKKLKPSRIAKGIENVVLSVPYDKFEIDLPDGSYTVVMQSLDYYKESEDPEKYIFKDYFSTTLVPVRGRLISIKELVQATKEIKHDCGYWGRFIEEVDYCKHTKCLRIALGS